MAYRSDLTALEARLAAIDGELADRTRERNHLAWMVQEARACVDAEELFADRAAGGRMRRLRRWALVGAMLGLAAVAMAGPPVRVDVTPVPSCRTTVDHATEVFRSETNQVAGMILTPDWMFEAETALTVERCTDDHWSKPVLRCLGKATSTGAIRACDAELSIEQRKRLDDALAKLIIPWLQYEVQRPPSPP